MQLCSKSGPSINALNGHKTTGSCPIEGKNDCWLLVARTDLGEIGTSNNTRDSLCPSISTRHLKQALCR